MNGILFYERAKLVSIEKKHLNEKIGIQVISNFLSLSREFSGKKDGCPKV